MDTDFGYFFDEDEDFERRRLEARRKDEIRRRKKKILRYKNVIMLGGCILVLVLMIVLAFVGIRKLMNSNDETDVQSMQADSSTSMQESEEQHAPAVLALEVDRTGLETAEASGDTEVSDNSEDEQISEDNTTGWPLTDRIDRSDEQVKVYSASANEYTRGLPENVASTYGIFIDMENGQILAQSEPKTRMFPASMTKVMTCLIAAEYVDNLEDTFVMTPEINYYAYRHDCSTVGFKDEEVVTIRDLFYGTMLPSGGEAAVALATYVAGSQEAFVGLMNDRLEKMGLSESSHFTNCVGLFDENHYSTCYDMAMIMEAAMENDLCREVMHAHIYDTSPTEQHPDGIKISNWFLRKIEDHVTNGEVYAAKTGYVNESGNCSASYGVDTTGHRYICVTGNSTSNWKCIKDHVAIYDMVFNPGG